MVKEDTKNRHAGEVYMERQGTDISSIQSRTEQRERQKNYIDNILLEIQNLEDKRRYGKGKLPLFILAFLGIGCIIPFLNDFFSGKADGVTQVYFLLSVAGSGLMFWMHKKEREEEKYLQFLHSEVEKTQNSIYS